MNLTVVRLQSPPRTDKTPIYKTMSIADDRFIAYVHGDDVHVVDLDGGQDLRPVLKVENCARHVLVANTLVTYDETHGYRRFLREGDRFVAAGSFVLPEQPPPFPTYLVLSPSGRYLSVELPPAAGEKNGRVVLFDTARGELLGSFSRSLSARASFSVLDGAEVLFLSAPSYMDVLLIDAASGRTLRSFKATTGWEFCHTDYELSAAGDRLLTFGCIWAAPYEVRLYDATPWTRGGESRKDGFPLPLLYAQGDDLQYETTLQARFGAPDESIFDVLSFVDVDDLRQLDAEETRDLEEGLSALNLEILATARSIPDKHALLQRRVDSRTGRVESFRMVGMQKPHITHVHQLSGHQALLLGDRLQWFDGERIHDLGPFAQPAGYYNSAVMRDGNTIVVRENLNP